MTMKVSFYSKGWNKNCYGSPLLTDTVTISGTNAVSDAAPAGTSFARIHALGEVINYTIGTAPVATAADGAHGHFIPSGGTVDIHCDPGEKIAGITPS